MPDLETVIPVWEHMKRTLVPEQDTNAVCMAFSSISAPDLETMIPIREHYNFFDQNLSSSVFRVKGI